MVCSPVPNSEKAYMASDVTLIRSTDLYSGAPYAYAAIAPSDARLIFLAGSCPLTRDGAVEPAGDYAGQARRCIDNMLIALRASGATIEDVISTRVLVASDRRQDLVAAWEVVQDAFGDHDVPSTLMGVTVLGYEDQLVEVDATAALTASPGETPAGNTGTER